MHPLRFGVSAKIFCERRAAAVVKTKSREVVNLAGKKGRGNWCRFVPLARKNKKIFLPSASTELTIHREAGSNGGFPRRSAFPCPRCEQERPEHRGAILGTQSGSPSPPKAALRSQCRRGFVRLLRFCLRCAMGASPSLGIAAITPRRKGEIAAWFPRRRFAKARRLMPERTPSKKRAR